MKIYKHEQVENIMIIHKNESEIKKDVKGAIKEGWTLLGDSMFGYEKNYLKIDEKMLEGFIKKFGDDFDFIKTGSGYEVLYTKLTRVVDNVDNKWISEILAP